MGRLPIRAPRRQRCGEVSIFPGSGPGGCAQADFEHFDLVLAMDEENHAALLAMAGVEHHPKIRLLLEFAGTGLVESGRRGAT